MKFKIPHVPEKWIWGIAFFLIAAVGIVTAENWIPALRAKMQSVIALFKPAAEEKEEDDHAHGGDDSIELSPQALRNIGVPPEAIRPVERKSYTRYLTVPAMVVERPGFTRVQVSSHLTGVIEGVYAQPGQAVKSGDRLFRIRLTHEDLVKAQTSFLETVGERKVVEQDIARLETLSRGLAPAKLRERKYERQKLDQLLKAKFAGLRLHGLSTAQIARIREKSELVREVDVHVPYLHSDGTLHDHSEEGHEESGRKLVSREYVVHSLRAHRGRTVSAGDALAILVDFRRLDLRGQAFEQDEQVLQESLANRSPVQAVFENGIRVPTEQPLLIRYIENEVDADSRALHFFIGLPNERVARSASDRQETTFPVWRFRPGQRLRVRVPIREYKNQFVLPVDAVARDGAEHYVFLQSGKSFLRRAVHVEYMDRESVVVAADGSIFPGDIVAHAGAYQMLMALKNKSGSADPHAGHSHPH